MPYRYALRGLLISVRLVHQLPQGQTDCEKAMGTGWFAPYILAWLIELGKHMFWRKKKDKIPPPDMETPPPQLTTPPQFQETTQNQAIEAMKASIATEEAQNPHIRAQITGKDIVANLMEVLEDEHGVRAEALLAILGSFAGFSIVYAMVGRLNDGSLTATAPEVVSVAAKGGGKFYSGNYINARLAEDKISVFGLTAATAKNAGATEFLDLQELFQRMAETLGKPDFGTPQLPPEHKIGDLPADIIRSAYPTYLAVLGRYDLPQDDYFVACAFAIQDVIHRAAGAIDPNLLTKIVMEYAAPASRLDPSTAL
ncbi:MAG: hypothetical protein AAFS08_14170 [Pseudomonadota bacterium]